MLILILLSKICMSVGECSERLNSYTGFYHYKTNITQSINICVNISIYGFYLIFNQIPDSAEIKEYKSYIGSSQLMYSKSYFPPNIPLYIEANIPFASYTISINCPGKLDFVYGSAPNICKTGLIITNMANNTMRFSDKSLTYFKLSPYEDKCVMFTTSAMIDLSINSNIDSVNNRILLYKDYENPLPALQPNLDITLDCTNRPLILRMLLKGEGTFINFDIKSDGINPRIARIEFKKPNEFVKTCDSESCSLWRFISPNVFILVIFSIILLILLIVLLIYVIVQCSCPQFFNYEKKPRVDPKKKKNSFMEKKTEPSGYYIFQDGSNTYGYTDT